MVLVEEDRLDKIKQSRFCVFMCVCCVLCIILVFLLLFILQADVNLFIMIFSVIVNDDISNILLFIYLGSEQYPYQIQIQKMYYRNSLRYK